jgi:hypothetical protein
MALKGWPAGAVTRTALAEAETPVEGPPVPILVVILLLLLLDARSSVAGQARLREKGGGSHFSDRAQRRP